MTEHQPLVKTVYGTGKIGNTGTQTHEKVVYNVKGYVQTIWSLIKILCVTHH